MSLGGLFWTKPSRTTAHSLLSQPPPSAMRARSRSPSEAQGISNGLEAAPNRFGLTEAEQATSNEGDSSWEIVTESTRRLRRTSTKSAPILSAAASPAFQRLSR